MFLLRITLILFFLISLSANSAQQSDQHSPEFSHSYASASLNENAKKSLVANRFMAVTAHPLSTELAYKILKDGGNAIDAAVAAQFMLGLVEPQSSGIGGGAFLVYYNAKKQVIQTFDGRETSPKNVDSHLFMTSDDKPMQFFDAVIGGRSVGVPGTVKLLDTVHSSFGSKKWEELIKPSVTTATQGFEVTPRLANSVLRDIERLKSDKGAYEYFAPDGQVVKVGSILKNPQYAETLNTLAKHGAESFYSSPLSSRIISKVRKAKNPGFLSQEDFDSYEVIERPPICSEYRVFKICGMGPPSSGQFAIAQILGIIENYDISNKKLNYFDRWQIISDASQLAFADRGKYIADPSFVPFDQNLLDKQYLKERSRLIKVGQAITNAKPGNPTKKLSDLQYSSSPELESTTHFVIADQEGNIVSMTSTIENGFGSRLMVDGFLLNNELTDFSFAPQKNSNLIANRVQANKRPRSSMAPTIVLENDRPHLAIGSPGGSRIINYVANTLVRILDLQHPLHEAINARHIVNRFGTLELEKSAFTEQEIENFKRRGYKVSEKDLNSGIHGILFKDGKLIGAADKRREGSVLGD